MDILTKRMDRWDGLISSDSNVINVETEILRLSGEIIAQVGFGLSYDEEGKKVLEKLEALQVTLYSSHFVGVPFGQFMTLKKTILSKKLGREIDNLILNIIMERKRKMINGEVQNDLLALLLACREGREGLSQKNLVDECKTFLFGGHETTAMALSWTFLCLALNPRWQHELREEIVAVVGQNEIDYTILARFKKVNKYIYITEFTDHSNFDDYFS